MNSQTHNVWVNEHFSVAIFSSSSSIITTTRLLREDLLALWGKERIPVLYALGHYKVLFLLLGDKSLVWDFEVSDLSPLLSSFVVFASFGSLPTKCMIHDMWCGGPWGWVCCRWFGSFWCFFRIFP
jgi:hypothetical protein